MIQQRFSWCAPHWLRWCAVLLMAALSACRPNSYQQEKVPATAVAPASDAVLYSIDSAQSLLTMRVYKEGPMAMLGHNHVIAVHDLRGIVHWSGVPERSGFALTFAVAAMSVDEPSLRAAAGADFSADITDAAREGTRRNMLGERLLDAQHYPDIGVQSERVDVTSDGWTVQARVTVHGHTSLVEFPVTVTQDGNTIRAHGQFDLLQGTIGLTPFSVALGAMRVADRMALQFDLVAAR